MLVTRPVARDVASDRRLAGALAAIAGVVNMAGYRAFGLFSGNMTGNVSTGTVAAVRGEWRSAALFASIVVAFVGGAAAAAMVIAAGRRSGVRSIHAFGILGEALFLGLLGATVLLLPKLDRAALLVPGLSFLMGLQNAVSTCISAGRVRTTHLSGIATDLGIELGTLADAARGLTNAAEDGVDIIGTRERLALHGQTLFAFIGGCVIGLWSYDRIGLLVLPCAAAALVLIALPSVARPHRTTVSASVRNDGESR